MNKLLFVCLLFFSQTLYAEKIYLTSLSWPPYSGESIEQQGASIAVAKAAFLAEGHELIVEFFPWSRAVKLASHSSEKYVGYFPEYIFETSEFIFSDVMGSGPLGILQSKKSPIEFKHVEDLIGIKLGVVQDYVNTKALDEMIAKGDVPAEAAILDKVNIMKVATGRLQAAVIDPYVFRYLLNTEKELAGFEKHVEMHENYLEIKQLFVAFRNDEKGEKWREIFNRGLAKIDENKIMAAYFNRINGSH